MIYEKKEKHPGGELIMNENGSSVNCNIDRIETTNDCLSSQAGLTIITRYLGRIEIVKLLAQGFAFLKRSSKGIPLLFISHMFCEVVKALEVLT